MSKVVVSVAAQDLRTYYIKNYIINLFIQDPETGEEELVFLLGSPKVKDPGESLVKMIEEYLFETEAGKALVEECEGCVLWEDVLFVVPTDMLKKYGFSMPDCISTNLTVDGSENLYQSIIDNRKGSS